MSEVRTGLFPPEPPQEPLQPPNTSLTPKGLISSSSVRSDEFAGDEEEAWRAIEEGDTKEEAQTLEDFLNLDREPNLQDHAVKAEGHNRSASMTGHSNPAASLPLTASLPSHALYETMVKMMRSGTISMLSSSSSPASTSASSQAPAKTSSMITLTSTGNASPQKAAKSPQAFPFPAAAPPTSPPTASTSATHTAPPTASTSATAPPKSGIVKQVKVLPGKPEDKPLSIWDKTKLLFANLTNKKNRAVDKALEKQKIKLDESKSKKIDVLSAFIYFLRNTPINRHDMEKIISERKLWEKGVNDSFTTMCFQIQYTRNVLAAMDEFSNLGYSKSATDLMQEFRRRPIISIHSDFLKEFLDSGLLHDNPNTKIEWKQIEELSHFFDKDKGINTEAIDKASDLIEQALKDKSPQALANIKTMMRAAYRDVLDQQKNNILTSMEAPLGKIMSEFLVELSTPVGQPKAPSPPPPRTIAI